MQNKNLFRLGKTELKVNRNGFGALPVQRVPEAGAVRLLHKAFNGGITFFDTARLYSDSEIKLGKAFGAGEMRSRVVIASKTMASDVAGFRRDLETSLRNLQTDYLDLYQFHNPPVCPKPDDESGLYDAMTDAVAKGMVRHIGITSHKLAVADEAIDSGLYETLQFPFNYLSGSQEMALVRKCKEQDMGFIAMKAMSGGLITDSKAAYTFIAGHDNVLPIWGIQRESELDEILSYIENPPEADDCVRYRIESDRRELQGEFCRGCGYCLPCPAGIEIYTCARMSLLLRRSPSEQYLTPEGQAKMRLIENCSHCNSCVSRCPYSLNTPELLRKNYDDYFTNFVSA